MKRLFSATVRSGLSLLELLIVVTFVGILAAIVVPRLAPHGNAARVSACHVNKGNIEVQTQLWFRNKNSWPAADLSDIGANTTYFPEGLPTCPVDGSVYTFNSTNQEVNGHTH